MVSIEIHCTTKPKASGSSRRAGTRTIVVGEIAKTFETCRSLIDDLKDYLEDVFPHATVTIRNTDANVVETFGRMIRAKQVVCSPSTFCLYPTLATHGHGYIVNTTLYPFVGNIDDARIHVMDHDFVSMSTINDMLTAKDANAVVAALRFNTT